MSTFRGLSMLAVVAVALVHRTDAQDFLLRVNLDGMRGPELISLIEAAVPEIQGSGRQLPTDISTLAYLHARLVRDGVVLARENPKQTRQTTERLEAVMRKELARTSLPELRKIVMGDQEDGYGNGHLFDALLHRWIADEVQKVRSNPKLKPQFPANAQKLPDYFESLENGGADTSSLQRAMGPYAKLSADLKAQKPRGLGAESEEYSALLRAFVLERNDKAAAEFLKFTWDSWCGTGAAEFESTKNALVLVGLLREGRVGEALGASFLVPGAPKWMRSRGRPFDEWRKELITFCGFEWEELLLASSRSWEFLAASGSDRGASTVLKQWRRANRDGNARMYDLRPVTDFLLAGEDAEWGGAPRSRSISPGVRVEILHELDRAIREHLGFHELSEWMDLLEELRLPETKGTLQRLIKHPSTTFAARAAELLLAFGESIQPIAPAPPVRFRLYLNGSPWRNAALDYTFVGSRLGSGSIKTDADGYTTIPRDEFLDPNKRGTALQFSRNPESGGVWTPRYEEAWIHAVSPLPKAYDEVTYVPIIACRVPIQLEFGSAPPTEPHSGAQIILRDVGTSAEGRPFALEFRREIPIPRSLTLSAIKPGRFELTVNVPGSARYTSHAFEVKPDMPPIEVKLEKGADVVAAIHAPTNARAAFTYRLYREGHDITDLYRPVEWGQWRGDDRRPLFSGVPRGKYELKVLSTAESIKRGEGGDSKRIDTQSEVIDCAGASLEFMITDSTPHLLDLGRLENPPVKR